MKEIRIIIRCTILAIVFASCTKSVADKNANEPFTKGTWQIASFTTQKVQYLDTYKNYRFLFDSDGSVAAADDVSFVTGKYKLLSSEATDDMPAEDITFALDFRNTKLAALNGNWIIREKTQDFFSMQQTKGRIGQVLVFKKL